MTEPAAQSIATEKRQLRMEMLAQRRAIPGATLLTASRAVARHFADHPILAFAHSFAGYHAIRGELPILDIFAAMARYDKATALPCANTDGGLLFRSWQLGDPLTRHALGMDEPLATAPILTPELILVPLLAFDARGNRLGYGAGYYDRTISAARRQPSPPLFVGVSYSMQEIAQVPTDAHDQPLDGILTELGVSMF